jgi:hypothetical protein
MRPNAAHDYDRSGRAAFAWDAAHQFAEIFRRTNASVRPPAICRKALSDKA